MDFCGPLSTGEYLLVIIDEHSRYPVVEIVHSVSANTVIPIVDKGLSTIGRPDVIKTDNGSPFNSTAFEKYAENSGFKHRRITPMWPRANAQAEAFNKPMMKAIRTAIVEKKAGSKNSTGFFDNIELRRIRQQNTHRIACCSEENLERNYHRRVM